MSYIQLWILRPALSLIGLPFRTLAWPAINNNFCLNSSQSSFILDHYIPAFSNDGSISGFAFISIKNSQSSLNNFLLHVIYVYSPVLGTENTAVNKPDKMSAFEQMLFWMGQKDNKHFQFSKINM